MRSANPKARTPTEIAGNREMPTNNRNTTARNGSLYIQAQGIDYLVHVARVSLGSHSEIFSQIAHCLIVRELCGVQLANPVLLRRDQEAIHEKFRKLGVLPFVRDRHRHFADVRLLTGNITANTDLDLTAFIPHGRDKSHAVRTINIAKSSERSEERRVGKEGRYRGS